MSQLSFGATFQAQNAHPTPYASPLTILTQKATTSRRLRDGPRIRLHSWRGRHRGERLRVPTSNGEGRQERHFKAGKDTLKLKRR